MNRMGWFSTVLVLNLSLMKSLHFYQDQVNRFHEYVFSKTHNLLELDLLYTYRVSVDVLRYCLLRDTSCYILNSLGEIFDCILSLIRFLYYCSKLQRSYVQEWAMVSRLTDEKASAIEQNQKLRQELVCFSYLVMSVYFATVILIVIDYHVLICILISICSSECLVRCSFLVNFKLKCDHVYKIPTASLNSEW